MKKKIVSLCLVICLALTAVVGGTLAWFNDTDTEKNDVTGGEVKIDLHEYNTDDGQWDEDYTEWLSQQQLLPYSYRTGNSILKRAIVENTGKSDAWMWIEVAVPTKLSVNNSTSKDSLLWFQTNSSAGAAYVKLPETKTIDGTEYTIWAMYDKTVTKPYATKACTINLLGEILMNSDVEQNWVNDQIDGWILNDGQTVYKGDWNVIVTGIGFQPVAGGTSMEWNPESGRYEDRTITGMQNAIETYYGVKLF